MQMNEIYIIRKDPITLDEWIKIISQMADWVIPGTVFAKTPQGKEVSIQSKGFAFWNGHSSGQPVPFDYNAGHIRIATLDDETLAKAKEVASLFNASVVAENSHPL